MTDTSTENTDWFPWIVAPDSGFEVSNPDGQVGLVQIDRKRFQVSTPFRFGDEALEQRLIDRMVGNGRDENDARAAIEIARTFSAGDATDLASVPGFMRWFENSYGPHTLAAIIHDVLIVDQPNAGTLGSDTVSDSFFREMMKSAGVPWLKRWIMWCAVALRSRWAAGGLRRISLLIWTALAIVGIGSFIVSVGAGLFDWSSPIDAGPLLAIGLVLPFASAPLWGKQYGASFVAAVAALWILPAGIFAVVGFGVYHVLERLARVFGLR